METDEQSAVDILLDKVKSIIIGLALFIELMGMYDDMIQLSYIKMRDYGFNIVGFIDLLVEDE